MSWRESSESHGKNSSQPVMDTINTRGEICEGPLLAKLPQYCISDIPYICFNVYNYDHDKARFPFWYSFRFDPLEGTHAHPGGR
jgi:hypothetical protein